MRIEEKHTDVLQNIEFAVAQMYREHPEMTDYAVMRVYEALIDAYAAERVGREPRTWNPTELDQRLFDAARDICEWRLGRRSLDTGASGDLGQPSEAIEVETLISCLKRLRKSVQKWTKRSGRQGYLSFMTQFVR